MRFRVRPTALAARQIRQEAHWWRRNRTKAPKLFREELRKAFALIAEYPESLCPRKNRHISRVASMLSVVVPAIHLGIGLPPGQVWPPRSIRYSTTGAAQFAYSTRVTSSATRVSTGAGEQRFRRAQFEVQAATPGKE